MKNTNNIKYDIGDILEVSTFAGTNVYKKVIKTVDRTTKWQSGEETRVKGFEGVFVRRKDLYALRELCVPYTGKEKLSKTKSFTFDWQIISLKKKARE